MTVRPPCETPPDPASPAPVALCPDLAAPPSSSATPLPPPLTPAESDLRGLPFMPLDTVRLLDSDLFALSTGDEFKCAVALWCKAWQQVPAGSLPDHERVLAHLSGAGAGWAGVRAMALHGWITCADGRLYHPVLAEKANHAWHARKAQRARAARRWHPEASGTSPTPVAPTQQGDATAYARESTRDSTRQSTEQGTPHKSAQSQPSAVKSSAPREGAVLRGSRLAASWRPDAPLQAFAATLGLDPAEVTARFRDYWLAVPGARGRKADWAATWRNWCRRECAGGRRTPPAPHRAHPLEEQAERMLRRVAQEVG